MPMSTLEGPKSGSAFQVGCALMECEFLIHKALQFSCGTNNIPIQIDTTTESDRIHDQDRDSGKIEVNYFILCSSLVLSLVLVFTVDQFERGCRL